MNEAANVELDAVEMRQAYKFQPFMNWLKKTRTSWPWKRI